MGDIEHARAEIGTYIHYCHQRPHSGLAYCTPRKIAATWQSHQNPEKRQTQAI